MKNLITLLVSSLLVFSANAAQYSFKNIGPSPAFEALGIVDSAGAGLSTDAVVQLGYFTDESVATGAAGGVFTSWTQFGSDVDADDGISNFATAGAFSTDGLFNVSISGSILSGSSFIGKSITMFVTNDDGDEFLAAKTNFTFAEDDPLTTGNVDLYDSESITLTYLFGGASYTGFTLPSGLGARDAVKTLAVPEPSTYALLGGLFALTCVMLRRRA